VETIDRVSRVQIGGDVGVQVGGNKPGVVKVPPELGRRLAAAGIDTCGDSDRLSVNQLARLLEDCHSVAQRIGLKRLVAAVGLYPRLLP
jgi:hypothetical protein